MKYTYHNDFISLFFFFFQLDELLSLTSALYVHWSKSRYKTDQVFCPRRQERDLIGDNP